MYNNSKILVSESEKERIKKLYYPSPSYVFENYMTIDGRFLIFNDNIFDLNEQKEIGNIFNLDNIKILFENVNIKNSKIVDRVKNILNTGKISLFEVKNQIIHNKKLLTEQETDDDVYKRTMQPLANLLRGNSSLDSPNQTTDQQTNDTANQGVDAAKSGVAITEPEVTSTETNNSVIAKGVLAIARKVKSLLWSVGGMAVDALLVASGIGKGFQWIPWAIILALDVYQWSTGDYGDDLEFKNSPTIWKGLNIGFEVLGIVSVGALSKAAAKMFEPIKFLKSETEVAKWVSKNPGARTFLLKMYKALSGVGTKLEQASEYLKKMPSLAQWFVKAITAVPRFLIWLSKLLWRLISIPGKMMGKTGEMIQGTNAGTKILGKMGEVGSKDLGAGLKAATNTSALVGGIGKGSELYTQYKTGLSPVQLKNLQLLNQI